MEEELNQWIEEYKPKTVHQISLGLVWVPHGGKDGQGQFKYSAMVLYEEGEKKYQLSRHQD